MNRQYAAGERCTFIYQPRTLPSGNPTLVISDWAVNGAMTPLRASIAVSAVSADRSVLTVAADVSGDARGLVGDYGGAAFLDLGADGVFPVELLGTTSNAGTGLYLASALPHRVPTTATGTLYWNIFYTTIAAATVGAVVDRGVRWRVKWTQKMGADQPDVAESDGGLIDVVFQPFQTGITDRDVYGLVPALRHMVADGQQSFAKQREMALDNLRVWVRDFIAPTQYEDQVDAHQFRLVHALLTAHFIVAYGAGGVGYDRDVDFEAQARALFEQIMKRPTWVDADDDGVVDAGELDDVNSLGGIASAHVTDTTLWTTTREARVSYWSVDPNEPGGQH